MGAPEKWLTRKEAANCLTELGYRITPRALETLAYRRKGPPYRLNPLGRALYEREKLVGWARRNSMDVDFGALREMAPLGQRTP